MKSLRNEKGLTLAELLAVLVIGSIIMIFISSLHIFVQKQYNSQSADAQHLTDVTIAAKAITKDIRSHEIKEVNGTKIEFEDGNTYEIENNVLKKNGADYIYEIETFEVSKDFTNSDKITLKIISTTGINVETEIIIR